MAVVSPASTANVWLSAVKTNGTLWAWGYNATWQLGDGTTTNRFSPVQVGPGHQWVAVAAGTNYTTALAAS